MVVVVAILALLATLGYGAVSNFRDSANVAASSSNLRQLAIAALTYAADHNATLPPHAVYDPELGQNREWCYGYFQFDTANALAEGILGPYLDDAESVLRCRVWQARADVQKMFKAGGKPGLLGYGYNGLNLSSLVPAAEAPGGQAGHYQGHPLASVADQSRTVMFATSAMPFGKSAAPQEMIWGPDHVIKQPCVRLVTDDQALVAFVDGSVRPVRAIPKTQPTSDGVILGELDLDEDGQADVGIWKK
jgi:hypothetical protein